MKAKKLPFKHYPLEIPKAHNRPNNLDILQIKALIKGLSLKIEKDPILQKKLALLIKSFLDT